MASRGSVVCVIKSKEKQEENDPFYHMLNQIEPTLCKSQTVASISGSKQHPRLACFAQFSLEAVRR